MEVEVSGERAIGAKSIGVAISGANARVVVLPAQAVHWAHTVQAPAKAGFLPESVSGIFVGRERELTELREMLTGGGSAAVVQSQPSSSRARAIHGLGGVGKSSLALHYADRYRGEYTLVWWIAAESPESIVTSLAGITARLCPQWAQTAVTDEQAAWAITWLQAHPGWLLIFDNVEEPAHLRPYLGTLDGGHHLATSRKSTGWHAISPAMALGLLPTDEATDLLCAIAFPGWPPTGDQRGVARRLAEDLGCLPLALEQAGAYAYRTGTDLDTYRQSLGLVLDEGRDVNDPERTIARIWDQTLTVITARDPLAVTLLQTMAWLAPDDIPRTLLAPLAPSPLVLGNALGELHSYNMIAFTDDRQGVSVHRLVQTALRHNPTSGPGAYPPGRQEAEDFVCRAMPDHDSDTTQWERLLPHLFALATTSTLHIPASPQTAEAFRDAAKYLCGQGRDAHTIPLHTATLAQFEQVLGGTHPDTLTTRNNLASAYQAAGDLKRAIPLFETTLIQSEQVLGDTHPDTLQSRSSLASAYQAAGDLKRAIPLFESTLAQFEQVLGDTHPDTLITRNNLAGAYRSVGDLGRAIPLFETTLAQSEQVLGDTHPDTLQSRSNLARAYQTAGDLKRAIPLFESTLAQFEQVLGDTHPDTLTTRNNLALAYQAAGRLKHAISLYKATLAQFEHILGNTHPRTLTTRSNLALAYRSVGDLGQAIPLFETTLAQSEQVLGGTHPDTLQSRSNLAGAYRSVGDLGQAIPLFETTLAQSEQVLGDTHPHTLSTRSNLAGAYESVGDLGRAIPLFETTLAQSEQVLGDTHPHTLQSRNNLAYAYESAGDLKRAILLFETTLAQSEQVLGDTHPNTLQSRNNLAYAYRSVGDLCRAIALFETTLAQFEQVLGDAHPDSLTTRNNLAGAYRSAGDLKRAILLFETTLAQSEQVLGDTHPDTLQSRNNLATAYHAEGDLGRAIPLYETALDQFEQVLGDAHPHTVTIRKNLASARRAVQAVHHGDTTTSVTKAVPQQPGASL